jgi:HEAT repeat protein
VTARERRRLLRALSKGDEGKRWKAATALVELADPKALRAVEGILQNGRDELSRGAAAYVLGFSGDSDSAPMLARVLADRNESRVVRAYAAEALGHLLQHDSVLAEVRTAIQAGLRDPAAEIRFWSAFAAGVLGLQETRPYLLHLAASDEETLPGWWSVAEEADWALRVLDGEEDPPLPGPIPVAPPGGADAGS